MQEKNESYVYFLKCHSQFYEGYLDSDIATSDVIPSNRLNHRENYQKYQKRCIDKRSLPAQFLFHLQRVLQSSNHH